MNAWNIKFVKVNTVITLLFLSANFTLYGQAPSFQWFYRVYFRDKGDNSLSKYAAEDLLSSKAISRRKKASVSVPDLRDIPVQGSYLDEIAGLGLKLHSTSKWMNTGLFKSESAIDIQRILDLPYVSDVKIVKSSVSKGLPNRKLDFEIVQSDLPPFDRPITMVNGYALHDAGFTGTNILIAVLDGGFVNADNISSLNDLRARKGIIGTHNFVNNKESVYSSISHGTAVLSILAGNIPGQLHGTAPGADYLLLKTEDAASEFPCEEDFWAAGAEFADSIGADIISSSLGYFTFDDSTLNYKTSDLDGNTAFVTQAADIAASKGILVVNSAGNERNNSWKYIIFPSDGDSVLAAGAVNGNNLIADFSSVGPSADRRIKPDNVAMGVSVALQVEDNITGRASGTSFSCPVLSGMAACLQQAVPAALNTDIIGVLHSSADRFSFPDSLYGYGIPDMARALIKLQDLYIAVPDEEALVTPNPNSGTFEIIFKQVPDNFRIEIFSLTGKIIFRKEYSGYKSRTLLLACLQHAGQGLYVLRISTGSQTIIKKIVKLNTLK